MNKLMELVGMLALSLLAGFANVWMLCKIYSYTVMPLGAPKLGMWQIWALSWFIGTVAVSRTDLMDSFNEKKSGETLKFLITRTLFVALNWGLTYWIFG